MRNKQAIPQDLLLEAIDNALEKVFGRQTMKAVNFYVDPRIATDDPEIYAILLEKLFQDGAKVLIRAIEESLCKLAMIETREWGGLEECVNSVREHLKSQTR